MWLLLFLVIGALCQTCDSDAQCNPPYEICDLSKNDCMHKDVFPLTSGEFFGSIVLFLVILLSAGAGIGGGGNIIPVLLILYRFSPNLSIALSNFNIFISSLLRYLINFKVKHPLKNAVLIDYEIVMLMMPTTLMGSLIGK